jgi:hypothetical protein
MLGFPHGALDVIMLERLSSNKKVKIRWQKELLVTVYICLLFSSVLFFGFFSLISALLCF